MTTGDTEETLTCGGQKETDGRSGGGEEMKLSFTTLSTIAVQAGQSQLVISVLKSGSSVHLQLVQVHPGLCEIGSNQDENQELIQEQQQLLEKLQKHETEVLSVVEKSRQKEQRRRRDEGMMGRSRRQEEEEDLSEAMTSSLKEGWSLLLRLLERRQEVLTLASDFYCRALEFAVSIEGVEDLQIRRDDERLTEVRLMYDSMRRDLLEKSLQVLTSSNVLLQKLRQLQRTEALQRRGGVLQDEEEEEEDQESSQHSRGMALRLEELVEELQDRRRRADQAVRLQLHKKEQETRQAGSEDWTKILDPNLQSGSSSAESLDLMSETRTEETRDLLLGSRSEETRDLPSGFKLNFHISEDTTNIQPRSSLEETKNFESGAVLKPGSRSEESKDLKPGFRSELNPESRLEEIRNMLSQLKNQKTGSKSDLKLDSKSEKTEDLPPGSRLDQTTGSKINVQPGSGLDVKLESRSEPTRDVAPEFRSEETRGSKLDPQSESGSELKLHLRLEESIDQHLESRPDLQSGSRSDLQPGLTLEFKTESAPKEIRDFRPESRSVVKLDSKAEESSDLPESRLLQTPGLRSSLQPGSGLGPKLESETDLKPKSRAEETIDLQPESKTDLQSGSRSGLQPGCKLEPNPESRFEEIRSLLSRCKFNLKTESRSDPKSDSKSEETVDLSSGSKLDQMPGSRPNPKFESGSDLKLDLKLEDTGSRPDPQSGFKSDLQPGLRLEFRTVSRPKETKNLQSVFELELQAGTSSDLKSDSKSDETKDLLPGSRIEQIPGTSSEVQQGSRLLINAESRSKTTRDVAPGSRSDETKNLQSGFKLTSKTRSRSDLMSDSESEETRDLQPGSRLDVKHESRSESPRDVTSRTKPEETRKIKSGSKSNSKDESRSDIGPESSSQETKDLQAESRSNLQSGSRAEKAVEVLSIFRSDWLKGSKLDLKPRSGSEHTGHMNPGSRSEETRNLESEIRSDLQPGSKLGLKSPFKSETRTLQSGSTRLESKDLQPGSRSELRPGSRSEQTTDLQPGSRSVLKLESRSDPGPASGVKPGSSSDEIGDLQSRSGSEAEDDSLSETNRKQEETKQHRSATKNITRGQGAGLESTPRKETQSEADHAHQAFLTNQRQQLLSSCGHLVDEIWSCVQQSSSVLCSSSEAGRQLCEAEDALNTHLQLQTQAESAGQDAETLKQILDQIRALHTDSTSRTSFLPPSDPSRPLTPLKALTEQLKRGRTGTAQPGPSTADTALSLSPELADKADLVLKELQSLNKKIDSNLQLLKPYVTFLRTAQQVGEEMEELRETYIRGRREGEQRKEEEREAARPPPKKKQVDACWQETLQRFSTAQELGNNVINTVATASGSGWNLQSLVFLVQQTVERLNRTRQEVTELQNQRQIRIQQQQEHCRKYRERLLKTLQDLNSVSELLDSCTLMDLGSDLQTSKLLERFSQARPHFTRLDAEVEFMEKSWETLRGVQDRLEELEGGAVQEEDLSELLELHKKVKKKIDESESILDMTSSFHLTAQKLEALLQSEPVTGPSGLCESSEAEQQIQNLFQTASSLRTDICTAVSHSGRTCFSVEQLEARLVSLDSLCVSWTNAAARRGEKLHREKLACRLNDDINQLRDSFKELKKRFSNLKFNYLKRNDRTRNVKAVRNQLQQVELYEEKLQALRKRLQGVTARLGSEVKDGGIAREAEDAINELQRQTGDFERSISDHQKTLEMTHRLQQAMEEYQFWCEEASATIARVGKFSSECRSTEAVSVLYRQFEKFVWPTVPQQEERISQIAELAVRLHGVEEGQRYIEKTVSKHSEMVEAIRELSDGLMQLEAKLKRESLIKQQNDGEKEMKEEGETERRRGSVTEEKDEEKEKNLQENRKMKKKEQKDNRRSQEAAEMYELKETGHTPEMAEHDGKEVPVRRQTAANRKPPLQKSRSLDTDRPTDRQTVSSESRQQPHSETLTSSYCSTHTLSLSSSPAEANRRLHSIHSLSQPVETPSPSLIGPSFYDILREFQKKETQEMGQQRGSNMTPLQDASAGGLLEAEEVMTEDSLSNDEYDCASPDDISLPPLAETPESIIFPSDIEEGFCFSSHSVHINQYSRQCHSRSDHSGTGFSAVRQLRESSRTESSPTPPTSLHSHIRFRSESGSFVQSPLTAPAPSLYTSTLCSILRTSKNSTADAPESAGISMGNPELSFPSGSNPVHRSKTPDSCSYKDNNAPEKRSTSQSEPNIKEHNSQYHEPQRRIGPQGKLDQKAASKGDILPQTDYICQAAELSPSPQPPQSRYCRQPFISPDPDLNEDKTSTSVPITKISICQDISFPQSFPLSESCLQHGIKSSQTGKETPPVSKLQENCPIDTSTSTISQQTIHFQSSPSDSHHTVPQANSDLRSCQESPTSQQSETLPQVNPIPQARGFSQIPSLTDSVLHKDHAQNTGFLKSHLQTSPDSPQDTNLPQSCSDSRSGLDEDVPSYKTSKKTSSVSMPQSSSLTTAINITQQTIYSPNGHSNEPQSSSNLRSQQGNLSPQGSGILPEVHAPIPPEPNTFKNISISSSTITSSNRFSNEPSHQTVYSLHESLTSSCAQQCVHDPGMSPAKPTGPPQPESQTQALAQQANPHVTLLSSSPHLLTHDQDPNICQPVAIREEIRLTPQIQGPSIPAPPPLLQAQAESLPQGKASKQGLSCFTRPLSRAAVMGGSPVTLEVEVTEHPEPKLTWFKDGEVSATDPGQALACEDRKHFFPEASGSDGGLYEAPAADHHDVRQQAGNSCSSNSGDKWLLNEVFDIISVDWQTYFGTLCVLLWLLFLIVL